MPEYTAQEENKQGDKTAFDDGTVLDAEVVSVKEKEIQRKDGSGVLKKLLWTFAIQAPGETYDGQYEYGETWTELRPGSEFQNWAQEVLAVDIVPGMRVNTDTLVGMQCRILMGNRSYIKNGEERTVPEVSDVMRSRSTIMADEAF